MVSPHSVTVLAASKFPTALRDGVLEDLAEWQSRPLDAVIPVVFIDALMVKISDGVVTNRAVYLAIGIDCDGNKAGPKPVGRATAWRFPRKK